MNKIRKIKKQWSEDSELFYFLISLCVLIFIMYPFIDNSFSGKLIINTIIGLLIFFATVSVGVYKDRKWSLMALALIVFISNLFVLFFDNKLLYIIHLVIRILFLYVIAYIILKKILTSGKISKYSIAGSIIVYLLAGLIWGFSYIALYNISPESFTFKNNVGMNTDLTWDFIYFSFTTLTTLGYGDILPNTPFPMSLAVIEGLIGQLYPVILIGRLVSANTINIE